MTEHALFHGCPECPASRGPDDIYNAGKTHRAACHAHRKAWLLGSNLLSSWRYETEEQQRERYREIEGYADLTPPRTADHRDDDYELGRRLKAQERIYNAALDSPITRAGCDFLFRARSLLRITDHDVRAAGDVIHTPGGIEAAHREFAALTDAERRALGDEVGHDWGLCVREAVQRLWHAAEVLGVDASALDAHHVALSAATMLSPKPALCSPEPKDGG